MILFWLACITPRVERDVDNIQHAFDAQQYPNLSEETFDRALTSYRCAVQSGETRQRTLSIIDLQAPSSQKRLWVIDVQNTELLFYEYIAHGKNSGEDRAQTFSNIPESHQSSIGLMRTAETYQGRHGLSLRLDGLEPGFNDRVRQRDIVIHGADYVSAAYIERFGRLGRSWGCPALRIEIAIPLIETIKGGSLMFFHYPDPDWISNSQFLNCE